MKNIFKYSLIVPALCFGFVSCQDDWDAHYNQVANGEYGNMSLYEVLSSQPELSDFCKVLDATKAFANSKQTPTTYRQLLDADQYFTVWAPVNGTFDCDSLLRMCNTSHGDSLVELYFVQNHVARYAHSLNGKETTVRMMNGKCLLMDGSSYGESSYKTSNIATRNGQIHIMTKPVTYYYNIYEALVSKERYQHVGKFFESYQVNLLDEKNSLPMGIVDGKTVYIDSVLVSNNELLKKTVEYDSYIGSIRSAYDDFKNEDSLFWMIMPNKTLWDSLYEEAKPFFNYGSIIKADSVSKRWTHYALLQDAFYNPRAQKSIYDSITSTTYYSSRPERIHTFYRPFDAGGLFTTQWSYEEECCNGMIYEVDKWPFDQSRYFRRINVEAETTPIAYEENNADDKTKKLSYSVREGLGDSISGYYYAVFTPEVETDAFYVDYYLPNVLSGTYDVCVVFLPRNVDPYVDFSDTEIGTDGYYNRLPSKFTATIFYNGTDGARDSVRHDKKYVIDESDPAYYVESKDKDAQYLFECNLSPKTAARAFSNNPFCVDTIKLCTMHFPTCNFAQKDITNRLRLTNKANKNNDLKSYKPVWFIDRILLLPHKEDTDN